MGELGPCRDGTAVIAQSAGCGPYNGGERTTAPPADGPRPSLCQSPPEIIRQVGGASSSRSHSGHKQLAARREYFSLDFDVFTSVIMGLCLDFMEFD